MSAALPWLTARDHLGVCIMAALIACILAPAIRDAFRALDVWSAANVDHHVSAALDPVDAHFDSLPGWVAAPTFADLRAPWAEWEKEMSA